MTMLIDSGGSRRGGGGLDPDEERRRRWEPISLRLLLLAVASLTCVSASGVTTAPLRYVLAAAALLLCAWFAREALRSSPSGRRGTGRR
jgi:hypothetical protein